MKKMLVLGLLLLTSCAAGGEKYADTPQGMFKPPNHMSNIIIYRPAQTWVTSSYWVEIDGQQVCDTHDRGFFVHHADGGRHLISSSSFGRIGTSNIEVNLRPGQNVYIKMSENNTTATILGGMLGDYLSNDNGPVSFSIISKETADRDMMDTRQDKNCQ